MTAAGDFGDAFSEFDEGRALTKILADDVVLKEAKARALALEPAPPAAEQTWPARSWDDLGNAARLVQHSGSALRYVPDADTWARWDGRRWMQDARGGVRAAMDMIAEVPELEAHAYSDVVADGAKPPSDRARFIKWAASQRKVGPIRAAAFAVQHAGDLDALSTAFDAAPLELNVANGIVDLATGELRPHEPARLCSQGVEVDYDPRATCPRWEAFLAQVQPEKDMREYLQRIVGYSLTADTNEQVMFMHYGETANGKSVFLRIMEAIMGSYSQVVPPTTLLTTRDEKHPTDVNRMQGKRMLQVSETPQGARLDEALVKRLSGQETITARAMGKDFREFRMVGKVHLITNHRPHISASDAATRRRLRLVHWPVTIPEEQRDLGLADSIIATELPGVLAWAVRGTASWLLHGLATPVQALMDADAYIAEEDELALWIAERTMPSTDRWESSTVLYTDYNEWCRQSGTKPMSKVVWAREMTKRGVEGKRSRTHNGFALLRAHVNESPLGW